MARVLTLIVFGLDRLRTVLLALSLIVLVKTGWMLLLSAAS
jgi:hypothetical protein